MRRCYSRAEGPVNQVVRDGVRVGVEYPPRCPNERQSAEEKYCKVHSDPANRPSRIARRGSLYGQGVSDKALDGREIAKAVLINLVDESNATAEEKARMTRTISEL